MAGLLNTNNINKTIRYLKRNGVSSAFYAALERVEQKTKNSYTYLGPTETEIAAQQAENVIDSENKPLICVIMPAYNTPEEFFVDAVESVVNQTYNKWELIIADASTDDNVYKLANKYENENRIKYVRLNDNLGISANTNAGISHATGDYITLLDHDDFLCKDALYHMAEAIVKNAWTLDNKTSGPAIVYSDEDKYDSDSKCYFEPHRKLKFNYDLILTNNYICHMMCIRANLFDKISLRSAFDGAQDYDLVLQIVRSLMLDEGYAVSELDEKIIHINRVLYHWRCHAQSTAQNTESKTYAYEAGLSALKDHLDLLKISSVITKHSKHLGFYKTDWVSNLNKMFELRPEVGAIAGRITDNRGRMAKCLLNEKGEWLYEGINCHFAGEFNRFDSAQDVFAADIRYICLNKRCENLLKDVLADYGYVDAGQIGDSADEIKKISMEFGKRLKEKGFLIVYLPDYKS